MHGGDVYGKNIDIDFSVNLNPVTMTPSLESAVNAAIAEGIGSAGRYPDIRQREVRAKLAAYCGTCPECIVAASGASQLIMSITHMCAPKKALVTEPSFSGFAFALSGITDCSRVRYLLREEDGFAVTADIISHMSSDIDIMYIQDVWNPTGKITDGKLLTDVLDKAAQCGITVILDQSFTDLSDKNIEDSADDAAALIGKYSGLFIVRSLTKSFAFPGIRMGYALSCAQNIRRLLSYVPEWNLSSIAGSLMTYLASQGAKEWLRDCAKIIKNDREYLCEGLTRQGMKVYESGTVFILFFVPYDIDLYEELLLKRILVRSCADIPGLSNRYIRVAVRSKEDNDILLDTIGEIINGH